MIDVVRGPIGDAAAVAALAAEAEAADGIGALSEQFRLGVTGNGPHLISRRPDGAPSGYAGIVVPPAGGPGAAEVVVAPSERRRGAGRALVTGAVELVGAGGTVWAHGDLPAARAVAADLGLTAVRTLLNLRRPLAGLDPAPAPSAGVTVRTYAGPADDAAILAVNNAAFSWHPEQGGWTGEQIDERTGADWFDPAGLFLAFGAGSGASGAHDVDEQDRLLGFHWTKVADPAAGLGEVYIVAVSPEGQGRGLGRLLTAVGLDYLAGRGLAEVELYVEGDNVAALRTYHRLGFEENERHVAYALP